MRQFLRNAGTYLPNYAVSRLMGQILRNVDVHQPNYAVSRLTRQFLRNAGIYLPNYAVSRLMRQFLRNAGLYLPNYAVSRLMKQCQCPKQCIFILRVQQSFDFQARSDRPFSPGVCMSIMTFSSSLFPASFPTTHRKVILRMVLKPSNDVNPCLGWWWYASKSNLMHGTVMQPFLQPEPSIFNIPGSRL